MLSSLCDRSWKRQKSTNPVHFNVVVFKAAFDIIWRGALWKMLRSIGVDPKITSLIEAMYENVKCAVVINGQLTEWFRAEIEVRQGFLLSPILFSLFLSSSWQT